MKLAQLFLLLFSYRTFKLIYLIGQENFEAFLSSKFSDSQRNSLEINCKAQLL